MVPIHTPKVRTSRPDGSVVAQSKPLVVDRQGDLHYKRRVTRRGPPPDDPPRPEFPTVISPARLALGALVALSVVACQSGAPAPPAVTRSPIAVSEAGCSPMTRRLAAAVRAVRGHQHRHRRRRVRDHRRGPAVVDEAENIVPGFVVNLSTRLDGGTYELVCGTLTSPAGHPDGAPAAPPRPARRARSSTPRPRDGIVADVQDLRRRPRPTTSSRSSTRFTGAVDAGDLAAAKAAYGPSRVPWERIEPIAELFADLDPKIDAREDDFEAGVDDPAFTGYHSIEKGLFADGTTDGLGTLTAGSGRTSRTCETRLDTLDDRPARHDPGRRRADRRGRPVEDDRRGGPLLEARSLVDRPERRGLGQDRRPPPPDHRRRSTRLPQAARRRLRARSTTIIAKYGDQTKGFQTFDKISPTDLKSLQAGLANLSELLAELSGRLGPGGLSTGSPDGHAAASRAATSSPVLPSSARPPSPVASPGLAASLASPAESPPDRRPEPIPGYIPFDGAHQAGIVTADPAADRGALRGDGRGRRQQAGARHGARRADGAQPPADRRARAGRRAIRSTRRRRAASSDRRSARPT